MRHGVMMYLDMLEIVDVVFDELDSTCHVALSCIQSVVPNARYRAWYGAQYCYTCPAVPKKLAAL